MILQELCKYYDRLADDPKNRLIGFSIFEQLGIGAYNPFALQVLQITRV